MAKGAAFWLARFGKDYREASRSLATLLSVPLPKLAVERLELVDALIVSQRLRSKLAAEAKCLASLLGDPLHGQKDPFLRIHMVATLIQELSAFDPHLNLERVIGFARDGAARVHRDHLELALNDVLDAFVRVVSFLEIDIAAVFQTDTLKSIDLNHLSERAAKWAANSARFEEWARLAKADNEARAVGPARIADALAAGRLDPGHVQFELETAFAEACWKRAIVADPDLAHFDGNSQNALVAQFVELEETSREAAVQSVRARHQAAIPHGAQGGMGVIRSEIARKRAHIPLRKLMSLAGPTIQKIKPVFLMSPISAAQFLPPGSVEFDILIIDEASQVRPEDALGLIARCKQIVVVGDKKQLPPTSFFDRMIVDENELAESDAVESRPQQVAPITDLESILSLCEARGLESRMLRWHYRSRHPSLIEVSNAEFYRHLIMPPAPVTKRDGIGLNLRRVQGAYDRGGRRTNTIEAEAIVGAVEDHAGRCAQLSLGIVTFSTVQRDLIGDILEARRRVNPVLDHYLDDRGSEDVFVKNLENVQGDERDVIMISIGYGPRHAGQPLDSMAFGPISAEGGERRLNVLFTRARVRCEVFLSFGPGEINLERVTGEGPRVLKRFLQFAESGVLDESRPTGADFDSIFEADVAAAIETLGYTVDPQIGSAGFRIDLAVRDPAGSGRYMLAVECDGATYHSALWARERDRLRQQVLEGLGWRFYRIWSTDWFYRRAEQLAKLKLVLEEARELEARNLLAGQPAVPGSESKPDCAASLHPTAYALAKCEVPVGLDLHEIGTPTLATIVQSIVEQEGPIHGDEIARRAASLFGKRRTSARTAEAVKRALDYAPGLRSEAGFWFTPAQANAPVVRDRSKAPPRLQRPEMIAMCEIKSAIAIARRQNDRLSAGDLTLAVAQLFGLSKAKVGFRERVLAGHVNA